MNGVGGDLFAIVYDAKTKTVRGLNASGRAAAAATPDEFRRRKLDEIPYRGVLSVSVPGVVDGWQELLSKHGTMTLARAVEPAIGYAREGFAVSEIIAGQWKAEEKTLAQDPAAAATFLPGGRAPVAGEVFKNPNLAKTLEAIARGGRDAFYRGPIAQAIAADMKARGGLLTAADLAAQSRRLDRAHLDDLSRLRGARAAAEHAGRRRARDAQHPRGLRRQGARPQLSGLSAPARRSQADRVCGSRGVARRCGSTGGPRAHQVQGVRGRTPARDRSGEGGGELRCADARRPDAGRAGPPGRQGRHHLHDGCRPRGQRRLADSVDLRELRRRHRRRRHGHHAAQPRQPLLAAARTSRTCSRPASGRSTRSCRRWS